MDASLLRLLASFLRPSQWQLFHYLALAGFLLMLVGMFWPQLKRGYYLRILRRELPPEMFAGARFRSWLKYYRPLYTEGHGSNNRPAATDLFTVLEERLIRSTAANPLIILGDAGSGKSAFAIHFFLHLRRWKRNPFRPMLLFLNSPEVEEHLARVSNPAETVLILDCLNEDWQAFPSVERRLGYLMERCAAFRQVIFTCRTAFLPQRLWDDPTTDSFIISSPSATGGRVYRFDTLRLTPPDVDQKNAIISRHAGVKRPAKRRTIRRWRELNPEWFTNPFFLSRAHYFAESAPEKLSLWRCFRHLEKHWLHTCSWWINETAMEVFLEELALAIYSGKDSRECLSLSYESVAQLAATIPQLNVPLNKWKFPADGFLARDRLENFSFLHPAIFEYYLMKRFRTQKTLPTSPMPWTDLMKRFALDILREIFPEEGVIDRLVAGAELSDLTAFRFDPVLSLRATPALLRREEIPSLLKKFNFYESKWHPDGAGIPACYRPVPGYDDAVVYDNITGLYWQRGGSESYLNFSAVQGYLLDLNRSQFGGCTSWRLPTLEEALSLLRKSEDRLHIDPAFDTQINAIWTCDTDQDQHRWMVGFEEGDCSSGDPGEVALYVRAVSTQPPVIPDAGVHQAGVGDTVHT